MPKHALQQYELTPHGLRIRLEDLLLEYLVCGRPSTVSEAAALLALQAQTGERVIIEKSIEGAQPAGRFFQDLDMHIQAGQNPYFNAQRIDYNFNQRGDGKLRKRIITGNENGIERLSGMTSNVGVAFLAKLSLHNTMEFARNIKLEEQMGINNQPVTLADVTEAMNYLNGATVLDPADNPVAILAA